MSRLTSKEVRSLAEAYSKVYASREPLEEQIWEEVEDWVNSLLEEGYDLSDYTWEEMYEAYIEEQQKTPPSTDLGYRVGRGIKGALSDLIPALGGQLTGKDNEALQRQRARGEKLKTLVTTGKIDDKSSSSSNQAKPTPQKPLVDRSGRNVFDGTQTSRPQVSNIPPQEGTGKGGPSDINKGKTSAGSTSGGSGTTPPSSRPAGSTSGGGSTSAPSSRPAGSTSGGGSTSAPAGKPASTAAPAAGTKEAGPESIKPKTPNPLMKNMPGRNQAELDQLRGNAALSSISQSPFAKRILSGTARSSQANEIGKSSLERSAAAITAKPAPAATSTAAPTGNPFKGTAATTAVNAATKTTPRVVQTSVPSAAANPFKSPGSLSAASSAVNKVSPAPKQRTTQLFHTDLFDLVKGYLLDEGYADTEEAALAIIENVYNGVIEEDNIQEALPALGILLGRLAGTAVGRATAARIAGTSAPGTIRTVIAPKVGEIAGAATEKHIAKRFEKKTPEYSESGVAESYTAYDVILDYLFDNGHVDTLEEAHYVMLEMDAEAIQSIVEEYQ